MRLMFTAVLVLAGLAAAAPDDAQIRDAGDDAPHAWLDVVAVWFEADDANLTVNLELAEAPPSPGLQTCTGSEACIYTGLDLRYRVFFEPLGPDADGKVMALAWFNNTDDNWQFLALLLDDANETVAEALVRGGVEENTLSWILPRASEVLQVPEGPLTAPYALINTSARSSAHVCDGLLACVQVGEADHDPDPLSGDLGTGPTDTAPDAGFGGNFTFPFTPPAPEPAPAPPARPKVEPEPEREPEPEAQPEAPEEPQAQPEVAPPAPESSPVDENQDQKAPGAGAVTALVVLVALAVAGRRPPTGRLG